MEKNLAFVLGGGGARGALQVGALKALLEAGYHPDLLVGTSIGAINAVGMALWGADAEGIDKLAETWKYVADSHLLDPRISRLILRSLMGLPNTQAKHRVENFLVDCGISRELTFGQLDKVRLAFVAADLNSGQPVIYGENKDQRVHEGLFASIAIPPWFAPIKDHDHFIVDGGAVSNLPIEPALTLGATQIIALDLNDSKYESGRGNPFNEYVDKLTFAVSRRLSILETNLALAQGISIHRVELNQPGNPPMWDFRQSQKLIQKGYEIAQQDIAGWMDDPDATHSPAGTGERPDNVDVT